MGHGDMAQQREDQPEAQLGCLRSRDVVPKVGSVSFWQVPRSLIHFSHVLTCQVPLAINSWNAIATGTRRCTQLDTYAVLCRDSSVPGARTWEATLALHAYIACLQLKFPLREKPKTSGAIPCYKYYILYPIYTVL